VWDPAWGVYPYPYLFPDYYPDPIVYDAPCGVWQIATWFNGDEVTAYWDPYLGGYYVYSPDWGYVQVAVDTDDVCAAGPAADAPPADVTPAPVVDPENQ
jgi:hypothetical protein